MNVILLVVGDVEILSKVSENHPQVKENDDVEVYIGEDEVHADPEGPVLSFFLQLADGEGVDPSTPHDHE